MKKELNYNFKYLINVKQRILLKKTNFLVEIEDGLAKVTYQNKRVAEESYKKMKEQKSLVILNENTIYDYYKNKKAKDILKLYIVDIEKAQNQNNYAFNVSYEVKNLKGGK